MLSPTSSPARLAAAAFILGATMNPLAAQSGAVPIRLTTLTAVEDLRISAQDAGLKLGGLLSVGPNGRIVIAPRSSGDLIDFDSAGKRLNWKVSIGRSRDDDVRWIERIGWTGPTMWIADPGFSQVAVIDQHGKVAKSLEHPSWVRPAWADRRKYPIFGRVQPLAVYADGSWLVIPSRERSLFDSPEYDHTMSYLVRISESGSIQKTLARVPREEGRINLAWEHGTRTLVIPYYPRTVWDVSSDGGRVAVVSTALTGRDSATFRLTVVGDKGDTLVTRRYPFQPVRIPPQAIDSVRQRIFGTAGTRTTEELRTLVTQRMPAFYPPVTGVHVGRDGTIWLQLQATPSGKPWLELDPTGAPIGTVTLPRSFSLQEADRTHIWGLDTDVVRLRVKQ